MRAILGIIAALFLAGCAVGQGLDGDTVVGFGVGKAATAANAAASSAFPWAAVIASTLGALGVGGTVVGHYRGKEMGWDEREKSARPVEAPNPFAASSAPQTVVRTP